MKELIERQERELKDVNAELKEMKAQISKLMESGASTSIQ
jgi:hypothetical protein